jgi:5-methylthioadenosine/S-adenosylhomocysteine deaminase
VIPVASPPLKNGAVLLEGDRILAVDRLSAFEGVSGIERQLGGPEVWLLPGFINCHYHHGRSFQLGYSDEPGEVGLFRTFSHPGLADPDAAKEFAYLDTLVSAVQLVRSGVTTTIDMAWGGGTSGLSHDHALIAYRDLGLAVVFAPIARDRCSYVYGDDEEFLATLPSSLAERIRRAQLGQSGDTSPQGYLAEWQDLYDRFDDNAVTRLILALDGPVWCSDELSRAVGAWAAQHDLPVHLHAAESKLEVDWALSELGRTPAAHLQALGLLGPQTSFAHGIWLSDQDMALCADAGVTIVHTPSSDLRWFCGIAPVVDLLNAGVNVALGTDGNGFADDNDFLAEMRIASLLQRIPGFLDWPGLSPETVIAMATVNGAKAWGLEEEVGSIEPGKRADLVLVDGDSVRGPLVDPRQDVQEVLVRRARGGHIQAVVIAGRVVMDRGRIISVNEDRAVHRLRKHYETLWAQRDEEREKLVEDGLVYVRRFFQPWEATVYPVRYRYNRC